MKPIDEQHVAEPGLVVLDITGGDEDTVPAVMAALEERWVAVSSRSESTYRSAARPPSVVGSHRRRVMRALGFLLRSPGCAG
ncbi:DUF6207 family protein [Streptomyces sp. NPDC051364]